MLTVQHITAQRNHYGRLLYLCLCDCGGTRYATAANLKKGEITNCGCQSHKPRHDLTGQRFGRLEVVGLAPPEVRSPGARSRCWVCRCDCGNLTTVPSDSLLSGNTTSCGCAQRDAVRSLYVSGTAPCKLTESQKPRVTNTSGVTGVYYDARRQKWVAEIMFQTKKYYLGRYTNKEDAIIARKEAEANIFGDFLD